MLKDFKENEKRTEKVLVLGVEEKKTARGSAFIVCSVTDGETKLEVKFWNTTKLMFEMFIHKVVSMTIQCESYNGGLSYVGLWSIPYTQATSSAGIICICSPRIMYKYCFPTVIFPHFLAYTKSRMISVSLLFLHNSLNGIQGYPEKTISAIA